MKKSLRFVNKTDFDSRGLRRLATAALDAFVPGWQWYKVTFEYRHRLNAATGYGWYHTSRMVVKVDSWWTGDALTDESKLRLVNTIAHKIEHNEGARHKDMACCGSEGRWTLDELPWIRDIEVLRRKEPPVVDAVTRREQKARAALAKWEAEVGRREKALKRARRKVSQLRARVRYYDKKAAEVDRG